MLQLRTNTAVILQINKKYSIAGSRVEDVYGSLWFIVTRGFYIIQCRDICNIFLHLTRYGDI